MSELEKRVATLEAALKQAEIEIGAMHLFVQALIVLMGKQGQELEALMLRGFDEVSGALLTQDGPMQSGEQLRAAFRRLAKGIETEDGAKLPPWVSRVFGQADDKSD